MFRGLFVAARLIHLCAHSMVAKGSLFAIPTAFFIYSCVLEVFGGDGEYGGSMGFSMF